MGLFSSKKTGGIMNVIRCDLDDYLVWKWTPNGQDANSTHRENSIRYGSSLRVKDGELAVFVYKQNNGTLQDFILGPFDQIIKTANFPVLSSIVGLAYGGDSPFQAEVYFINLSNTIQIKFAVPYFDIYDPRFQDLGVPVSVHGNITFGISDYKEFIKLNRLVDFDLNQLKSKIKDAVIKFTKNYVINCPLDNKIPVLQVERKILDISDAIQKRLTVDLANSFGISLSRLDISNISIDKESSGYSVLYNMTVDQQQSTINAQGQINIKNMDDLQRINSENLSETLRIQREETQRAQKMRTETNNIVAFSVEKQAEVLKASAENLGQMGTVNLGGNGGSMNPAGVMTGMMLGGAIGQQMSGMINQMGNQVQNSMNTPPPMPTVSYFVGLNGQQTGPFTVQQLTSLIDNGQMNEHTLVWKQGLEGWVAANTLTEFQSLFSKSGIVPPPFPNM